MKAPGKAVSAPKGIRWTAEDWARIREAAERYAAEQHIDMTPVGFVRMAARRMCDAVLGPSEDQAA